ncbi:hypothetical protein, partial [Klebsiella pneumoniae]|uniref:hypothetical protein n=1 Tax=Klebsiella pneumoniae TaxID=573 RepID=UPI001A92AC24
MANLASVSNLQSEIIPEVSLNSPINFFHFAPVSWLFCGHLQAFTTIRFLNINSIYSSIFYGY